MKAMLKSSPQWEHNKQRNRNRFEGRKKTMKTIKTILISALLCAASTLFADWSFSYGTFTITGDTTIYLDSKSSLYIQDFGYTVNGGNFVRIPESDFGNALSFKDGDKVRFMKKGLFFDYFARETGNGHFTIDNFNGGMTAPFSFTISSDTSTTSPKPSGQPLPSVAVSAVLGLIGISAGFYKIRRKK